MDAGAGRWAMMMFLLSLLTFSWLPGSAKKKHKRNSKSEKKRRKDDDNADFEYDWYGPNEVHAKFCKRCDHIYEYCVCGSDYYENRNRR